MASRFSEHFETEFTGSIANNIRQTAEVMQIGKPNAGAVQIADVQRAFAIKFGFDLSDVKISAVDVDLVFHFPDGSKLVLPGLALSLLSADPPQIAFNDATIEPAALFTQLGDVKLAEHVLATSLTTGEPDKTGDGQGHGPGETQHTAAQLRGLGGVGTTVATPTSVTQAIESLPAAKATLASLDNPIKAIPQASPGKANPLADIAGTIPEAPLQEAKVSVRLFGVTQAPEIDTSREIPVVTNGFAAVPADTDPSLAAQSKRMEVLGTDRSDLINAADFARAGSGKSMRHVELTAAAIGKEAVIGTLIRVALPIGFEISGMQPVSMSGGRATYEFMLSGKNTISFDLVYGLPGADAQLGEKGYYGDLKTLVVELVIPNGTATQTAYGKQLFAIAPRTDDGPLELTGDNGSKIAVLWSNPPDVAIAAGAGDDTVMASASADLIDGGTGLDIVSYAMSHRAVQASLVTGGKGGYAEGDRYTDVEGLEGSQFADRLTGNGGDNVLIGGAGADTLEGGAGRDVADYSASKAGVSVNLNRAIQTGGEAQGDVLSGIEDVRGSAFRDDLTGTAQANRLSGNAGNDTLKGGGGDDTLDGGDGIDTADFSDLGATDSLSVMLLGDTPSDATVRRNGVSETVSFANIENIIAGRGNDTLTGDDSANNLVAGDGNDSVDGRGGNDVLDGGDGIDVVTYAQLRAGQDLSLSLLTGKAEVSASGGAILKRDKLTGFENVMGGGGNDTIIGSALANDISGLDGQDSLDGGIGHDTLRGGRGDDTLIGGEGDDTLDGGEGQDSLIGGAGRDTLNGGAGNDVLDGGDGDDVIVVSTGDDTITGGDGIDAVDYSTLAPGNKILIARDQNGTLVVTVIDALGQTVKQDRLTGVERIIGTDGNDLLAGDSAANSLVAGTGNDTLRGEGGDTLDGGAGTDTADYSQLQLGQKLMVALDANGDAIARIVTNGVITASDALVSIENVTGSDGADDISGNAAANLLRGGAGNDTLKSFGGADTLDGGAGDDSYFIDGNVSISDSGGVDTILLTSAFGGQSYTLDADIERLDASAVLHGMTLLGNARANTIVGTAFSDTLAGGGGNDILQGGKGDDRYLIDSASVVTVETANEGNDSVELAQSYNATSYQLTAHVETLDASRVLTGMTLSGNELANRIIGTGGDDTINGGAGTNTLEGGAGDDRYIVENNATLVSEDDAAGHDTIILAAGFAESAYSLASRAHIEDVSAANLTASIQLTGNNVANSLKGGAGHDTLDGGAGADTLEGGAGNDRYVIDSVNDVIIENANAGIDTIALTGAAPTTYTLANTLENIDASALNAALTLTGNDSANAIIGGAAADTINAGKGNDTIDGRSGSDLVQFSGGFFDYNFDVDQAGNFVVADQTANRDGADTLIDVENLSFNGTVYGLTIASNAGGTFDMSSSTNPLLFKGGLSADHAIGGSSQDFMVGGAGNDTLDGGAGSDTLIGGAGDDLYIVDRSGDVVDEGGGSGNDTIKLAAGFASASYTLGATPDIENLDASSLATALTLSGNASANNIMGGSGHDLLLGDGGGNDTLNGGAGNDKASYVNLAAGQNVQIQNDGTYLRARIFDSNNILIKTDTLIGIETVSGSDGHDRLALTGSIVRAEGGAGHDTLDGTNGAGTLIGGAGDDVYIVGQTSLSISEAGGGGTDTVRLATAFAQATYGLDAGNTLENIDASQMSVDLALTGNDLANSITGGAGHDTLDGGAGADTLKGGAGNDLYRVDNASDVVDESSGSGIDTVELTADFADSAYSIAMFTGVEHIDASALTDAIALTGNSGANSLLGGAGDDLFYGSDGNDTLNGGAGQNTVDYTAVTSNLVLNLGSANAQTISGAGDVDTLISIQHAIAGSGHDSLTGSSANNSLFGGDGNDTLAGGAGNDTLDGGDDSDTVSYATLNAGWTVSSTLSGGDVVVTTYDSNSVIVKTDRLISIENVIGSGGNDSLVSASAGTTLNGGAGNDTLTASSAGGDILIGGDGDDVYRIASNTNTLTEAANGGQDRAVLTAGYSDASYTLASEIEILDAGALTSAKALIANGGDNSIRLNGVGGMTVDGGAGIDTLDYSASSRGIVASLRSASASLTGAPTLATGASFTRTADGNGQDLVLTEDNSNSYHRVTLTTNPVGTALTASFWVAKVPVDASAADTRAIFLSWDVGAASGNWFDARFDLKTGAISSFANAPVASMVARTLNGVDGWQISFTATGSRATGTSALYFEMNAANGARTYTGTGRSVTIENLTITGSANNGSAPLINSDDTISNVEHITGSNFDDQLIGNDAANSLVGGTGHDTLTGGGGNDTLVGGVGNDTYVIDIGDSVVENANEGTDTIVIAGSYGVANYTLAATLEHLNATGALAAMALTGNASANSIFGSGFNDTLDGKAGSDTLVGALGNDIYVIDDADTVVEVMNGGSDTVKLTSAFTGTSYTLALNAEIIDASEKTTGMILVGNSLNNTIIGGSGSDQVSYAGSTAGSYLVMSANGADVNVAVYSSANALLDTDRLSAIESVIGTSNNDTLAGGSSAITLMGGLGNDVFLVSSANHVVSENAGAGTDSVVASVNWTLDANLENLSAAAGAGNLQLTGNSLANIITGGSGHDTLNGADGNDTIIAGLGNDSLDGGTGINTVDYSYLGTGFTLNLDLTTAQTINGAGDVDTVVNFSNVTGGSGNDSLTGTSGSNVLLGGLGNDTLAGNNGTDTIDGGGGTDTMVIGGTYGSWSYSLVGPYYRISNSSTGETISFTNIEFVRVTGSGTVPLTIVADGAGTITAATSGAMYLSSDPTNNILDFSSQTTAIANSSGVNSGTAWFSMGSYTIFYMGFTRVIGTNFNDNVTGLDSGNNNFDARDGNDTVYGNGGNDTLLGGLGNDILRGGTGNDSLDGGGGSDTLDYSYLVATQALSVTLTNSTNATATVASTVGGLSESDIVTNFETVLGGAGNDFIVGNSADNSLSGNSGNDTLSGGAGNDTLDGGVGTDTADYSYVSTSLNFTLQASGSNTIVTVSASDIDTLSNIENITGGSANDTITGNSANNLIIGGAGDDRLSGGGGDDTLDGGAGTVDNVRYANVFASYVLSLDANGNLVVTDLTANRDGSDTIIGMEQLYFNNLGYGVAFGSGVMDFGFAGWSQILVGGAGNETIIGGSQFDQIFGAGGNDSLLGNSGTDILCGGAGNDTIDGGGGSDTVDYSYATTNLTMALNAPGTTTIVTVVTGTDVDTLLGIEGVIAGSGNDSILGNSANNTIDGGSGNDTLNGGVAGIDRLLGGLGNDTLILDLSQLGNGSTADGGASNDIFQFSASASVTTPTVTLAQLNTLLDNTETIDLTATNNRISLNGSGGGIDLSAGSADRTALTGIGGGAAVTIRYNASGSNDQDTIGAVTGAAASDATGTAGTSGYTQNFYGDAAKTQLLLTLIAA